MISDEYLQQVATDLYGRIGSVLVNDTVSVPIKSVNITGKIVTVETENVEGISKVSKVTLLDTSGKIIDVKHTNLEVPDSRFLDLLFQIEAKGGTI
jgi:hypothetical protein